MGGHPVKGRKRHIVVDTLGLRLRVWLHEADLADSTAAAWWVALVCAALPTLRLIWAAGAYTGGWAEARQRLHGVTLVIVQRLGPVCNG